ncbi:hypothetical protein [Streptacidiphilus rugosus]|uniref:hypothetical protein n=1 Tax=Streptacidiphilus rugosus TaxID=405783 RepID=UPI0005611293|nr:hypothetical protein [Streptacidiphilus rugosus]
MSSRALKDELVRLLVPPTEPWAVPAPDEIARWYGTPLPSDFLWLMERYGPGLVSDYLGILPPVAEGATGEVHGVGPCAIEPMEGWEGIEPEYLVHGGLYGWGCNPDGDGTFWSTTGAPDEWRVVVCRRHHGPSEPAWTRYDCGIVEFLVRTFQGRLPHNPFSGTDLWGNASPTFAREAW